MLTPNTGATIPPSGVRVAIDDVLLPDIPATFNRADITSGFPGFNTTGAGRSVVIDTTKYTDGLHTIAFLVTDSSGQADGVGGRFFRIDNSAASGLSASLFRTAPVFRPKAETTGTKNVPPEANCKPQTVNCELFYRARSFVNIFSYFAMITSQR